MQEAFKKIVLVTSGQPALNPRLVKEADALSDAGYEVTVIYAYWNQWGDEFTKQLLPSKKWKAVCAGGHPVEKPLVYLLSRMLFKFSRRFGKAFQDAAIARCTPFLIMEAKKHEAGLYIGHNLGALPAVVKAAEKYGAKCGFDAEDFHRMEMSDDSTSPGYLIAKTAEDRYFPRLDYISASSPEITEAYRQLYPQQKFETILNVFNRSDIQLSYKLPGKIKLFWFSQMIGRRRGLQDVIGALNSLPGNSYELHLLGKITDEDKQYFNNLAKDDFIHFHSPVHPDEIIALGAQFDIGLALEPGFSTNNRKALSNKLFSYLQSGLAIIATETEAQYNFLKANPVGRTYPPGAVDPLKRILTEWQENPQLIVEMKQRSLTAGRNQFNWETESKKFLSLITNTLAAN